MKKGKIKKFLIASATTIMLAIISLGISVLGTTTFIPEMLFNSYGIQKLEDMQDTTQETFYSYGMGEENDGLKQLKFEVEAQEEGESRQIILGETYHIKEGNRVNFKMQLANINTVDIKKVKLELYEGDSLESIKLSKTILEDETLRGGQTFYKDDFTIPIMHKYMQFKITAERLGDYESTLFVFNLKSAATTQQAIKSPVSLTTVDGNLPENPNGVVYVGDQVGAGVIVYNLVDLIGDRIVMNPDEYYEVTDENGNQMRKRYKNMTISISIPNGIEVDTSTIKFETNVYKNHKRPSAYYDNSKRAIIVYMESLSAYERGVLEFEYRITSKCSRYYELTTKATLVADVSRKDKRAESWSSWREETEEHTGESLNYVVGVPNIQVDAKDPYALNKDLQGEGEVTERHLYAYEFEITNTGDAAAKVNFSQFFNMDDMSIYDVTIEREDSEGKKYIDTFNGNLQAYLGIVYNGEHYTIRVTTFPKTLEEEELQKKVKPNDAIVTAKASNTILAKVNEVTVVRNKKITQDQRRKLLANCSENIIYNRYMKKYGDIWYMRASSALYCIEPGGAASVRCYQGEGEAEGEKAYGDGSNDEVVAIGQLITREVIYKWYNEITGTKKSDHGCAGKFPHEDVLSTTYWACEGRHYTESSDDYIIKATKNGEECAKNLYDAGFILSWTPKFGTPINGKWSAEQQQAVWQSVLNVKGAGVIGGGHTAYRAQGVQLYNIAKTYKEFYEQATEDEEAGESSLKPKSLINYHTANNEGDTDMELEIDEEEELVKIGPFKLDYVDGSYQSGGMSYSFGGISDMYLLDENDNRINIENLKITSKDGGATNVYKVDYAKEGTGSKTFFSIYTPGTSNTDGNKMDWNDKDKHYPKPEEEFYVEVSFDELKVQNGGMPGSLKLKAEFQHLVSEAAFCIRHGKALYITSNHEHKDHIDTDPDTGEKKECFSCKAEKAGPVEEPQQDIVVLIDHNRTIITEELIVRMTPEKDGTQEPTEPEEEQATPYFPVTMKIGGFVFQDELEGKESEWNGIKTEADVNLSNIKVELYDAETNELAVLRTLAEERPDYEDKDGNIIEGTTYDEREDKADYTRRTNPTLTDEKGYYEFRRCRYYKKVLRKIHI